MKAIWKIARTELQTLFYSPVAWLILIVFTFQASMTFSNVFSEFVRSQDLGYSLRSLTLNTFGGRRGLFTGMQSYLYLYIPLLTMGLISREFSSGSIKLLYSSPLTNKQIIFGKYLAMMIYGFAMIAILTIFLVFAGATIERVDIPVILSGLLGLYLLICAYAAIGLFMSSLTSYQVVAAMGTFAVLTALNFVGDMWQEIEFVRDITYWLSIGGRSGEMINGLICSEDVLYFVIVSMLFILLTILRLQSKRQKARTLETLTRYVVVIVGAMLLGYVTSRPKMMAFYDATRNKVRTLTPNSQDIVARMEGGLTVTTYVNILDRYYSYGLPRNVKSDLDRFKQYWRFKPEIKFKYVYYYDKSTDESLEKRYPGLTDRERMVKVANSNRLDTTMFMPPEAIKKIIDLEPESNRFVRLLERNNGQKTFLRIFDDMYVFPDESQITAAFKRLVMPLPRVGFLSGHGERDCIREGDRDYNRFAQDKPFRHSLINSGFDFEQLSLERDIPENIHILVIADMRVALTSEEQERLDRYIARGGNLLIAGEPRRREVMNLLLAPLGVTFMPGSLVKDSENFDPDFIIASPTAAAGEWSYHIKEMIRYEKVVTMPGCSGLEYREDMGFKAIPILVSDTVGSWNELETTNFIDDTIRFNPAIGEVERAYVTALALSREVNGKEQKIMVLGDADCLSNGEISILRKNVRASNYSLISAAFFWMSDEEVPIDVRRPTDPDRKIRLGVSGMRIWKVVLMGIIPALLIFFSILIWIRRRGR